MARRRLLVAWAAFAIVPALSFAQSFGAPTIAVGSVSEKLGVKASQSAPLELDPGRSVTTTLSDPKKLDPYIKGMHEGARVTISCVGPGRIRVEAEEMEPVEQRTTVTLRVAEDGVLTPASEKPATPPKPPI
jgi:hypothetical protein